jgi:arginine decarboxylase
MLEAKFAPAKPHSREIMTKTLNGVEVSCTAKPSHTQGEPLGLEAGSKAELMAVLAHAGMTRSVIVCNGYKDREYIRLALIGEKMGHKVYLVIEKMSEIAIVLEEAERLNVVPRLGVRARLASQGSGKWQSSGGEKSKFGLAANQVLQLVEIMREHGPFYKQTLAIITPLR